MMLRLVFLSTLIWLSSSQRYFFPSYDKADFETAKNICQTRNTGEGRMFKYYENEFYRMRRLFRNYEFAACEKGENCSEFYVDNTRNNNTECQILQAQPLSESKDTQAAYTDCTTPRRFMCQSRNDHCQSTPIIHNCLEGCAQTTSYAYNCTKCAEGFTHSDRCIDDDECLLGTHDCHELADCINTRGSFECKCKTGIGGDGRNCQDYDECLSGTHQCQENVTCVNTLGSYECGCETGFEYDGNSCQVSTENRNANTAKGTSDFIVPVLVVGFLMSFFAFLGLLCKQKRAKSSKSENKDTLDENYDKSQSRSAYQN